MIRDPDGRMMQSILTAASFEGASVLEIGCGSGRITRQLAKYAASVVGLEPSERALRLAKEQETPANLRYVWGEGSELHLPGETFTRIVYALSLHHVPVDLMDQSLQRATNLLSSDGAIIVVEPGTEGSMLAMQNRFGFRGGDEREEVKRAYEALCRVDGWQITSQETFRTRFLYDSLDEVMSHMPDLASNRDKIRRFLEPYRSDRGFDIDAERKRYVLKRA